MTRPLGCWFILLPVFLIAGACQPAVVAARAPALDRDGLEAILVAADAARIDSFAKADPQPLHALYSGSAISAVLPELTRLRERGQRIEELDDARRLVHWAVAKGSGEGVLEVAGEQRIALLTASSPTWSRTVRQWWAALAWSGGRWLVVGFRDLPPGEWWPA